MNIQKFGANVADSVSKRFPGVARKISEKAAADTSYLDKIATETCSDFYIKQRPAAEQKEIFFTRTFSETLKPKNIAKALVSKIANVFKKIVLF